MLLNKIYIKLLLIIISYKAISQVQATMAMSQSFSNDWKTGSINSVELLMGTDVKKHYFLDTVSLDLTLKFAVGAVYEKNKDANTEYIRPTDNELSSELVVSYPLGWMLDPFVSASLQTQLTESFKYIKENRVISSKIWDPVTTQQSLGFAYSLRKEKDYFTSRIGISYKQIRADKYTQLTDGRSTKNIVERYKEETGIQFKTECMKALSETVQYKSTLDLFGTFEDLSKWTVKWLNEFQFKVWEFLAVTFKLDIIYDEKQMAELQYKQSMRFGIVAGNN